MTGTGGAPQEGTVTLMLWSVASVERKKDS
jgi:hypothetical protein